MGIDNLVTILDGYFENSGQHVSERYGLEHIYEKIMSGEVIVRISELLCKHKYLTPEQKLNWHNVSSRKFFQWMMPWTKIQIDHLKSQSETAGFPQKYSEFWKV